ncbi:MAG: type IV pilus secretin PilQ, partial [Candidatus Methylopumilus sp.]|nr:type IV pilus secretin PilQ [Candidatus Methylopumilus sp.]
AEPNNKIEKISFANLPGGKVTVTITTAEPVTQVPASFTLDKPARIALDFPKMSNGLGKSKLTAEQGGLASVSLAEAKGRTRVLLNLTKKMAYSSQLNGKEIVINLQESSEGAPAEAQTSFAPAQAGQAAFAINNVDFARGKNGEGRITVDLSDSAAGINIKQKGKGIVVDFINADLPANLQRRLNVINFATPVHYIDTVQQGKNVQMTIEPKGDWEQSAYQTDKKFIIDVRPLIVDPNKLARGSKGSYVGEKLSLNFQKIEVRAVLQVIADFTGLNIVASDTVTGNLTLRLKDVPWDQAMDIVLQSKALAMRKTGNVILVAPAEELANKEKQALEASQQIEDLELMRTEVYTLRYMKAADLVKIITDSKQKILSKRGSAVPDIRTNNVFVQDTAKSLEQVQAIIEKTDVPVKQVMIESRLVIADDRYSKALGARFGVNKTGSVGSNNYAIGGNIAQTGGIGVNSTSGVTAASGGTDGLQSNLGVTGASGSFAFSLFRLPAGLLLNLELTAMESDGRGKVVSSPRVTTANQHKAKIASGTEIPYAEASSSGAATISFKSAVLSLEVTPQITPDNKIIMELDVTKDSVGEVYAGVPSIKTQNISTQVLVGNGETAVLGGIYEQTQRNDVSKVPFFGDLPIMGRLFQRKTSQNDRTELLIFVTPKIMDDSLTLR